MTTPLKAVLIDIRTFLADNNIRRNTSAFSVSYASESEDVNLQTFTLLPGASKLISASMSPSVVTLLRTTLPLTAQVTLGNSTVFTIPITKLFILDADVVSIHLTNPNSVDAAKVSITQG